MDNHQILAKTGKLKEALINLYLNFNHVFNFCFFEQSEFIRLQCCAKLGLSLEIKAKSKLHF